MRHDVIHVHVGDMTCEFIQFPFSFTAANFTCCCVTMSFHLSLFSSISPQEPELQHILLESKLIETQYSHYFDWIIVNDDLSVSLSVIIYHQ